MRWPRSAKLFATAVARRFCFAFHRWPSTRFDAIGDAGVVLFQDQHAVHETLRDE